MEKQRNDVDFEVEVKNDEQ